MEELSNAETALLGLLCEGSMYLNQIEQEVQDRDLCFWTELSMNSLHKILLKLEKDGLVILNNSVSADNRLKESFTINESGKIALQKKLDKILSSVEHIRWQIDIGTYNSNLLPEEKVRECLNMYRTKLKEKMDGYKDLLLFLQESHCPVFRQAVVSRPIYLLEAEIRWVDSFLNQLTPETEHYVL